MSDAISEAMSNLREHAPTLPSAKEAREAVKSHLPSVDVDAIRTHLPSVPKPRAKRSVLAAILAMAAAAALVAEYLRRHREPAYTVGTYTPPMPRP
jgi:ferric-dicitrate binding protein FerR (iron transport regulator)